jgi:hypothetical protein
VPGEESTRFHHLSSLRQPSDEVTLQSLLTVLSSKLELSGRLPLYAFEADKEGLDQLAHVFGEVREMERRSVELLRVALLDHLREIESREVR